MTSKQNRSRHIAFGTITIAIAIAIFATSSPAAARDDPKPNPNGKTAPIKPLDPPSKKEIALAHKVLALHNKQRDKENLPPLEFDDDLTNAARAHAIDMAERAEMTHEGSDGSKPEERIDRAGFHGKGTAENIARFYPTPEAVMRGWMNSPGHKKNILGDYRRIGIGVAVSQIDDRPYWCVDFGLPWPKIEPAKAIEAMVREINDRREVAEKPALKELPALSKLAEAAARAAAELKGKPPKDEGKKIVRELSAEKYPLLRLGLAGAVGQSTPKEVVDAWFGDPSTRQQLLGDFSEVGVGVATDPLNVPVWRIILARPRE